MSGSQDTARYYPAIILAKAVIKQSIRQKEFQLILILMILLLGTGLIAPAILKNEGAQTHFFFVNFGLSFAFFCAQFLTLLAAARQYPQEFEQRTILPLMSKPISRNEYILGKWLGTTLLGIIAILLLVPLWLISNTITLHIDNDIAMFFQMIALQCLAIASISALAILGSLFMPFALNLGVVAILVFKGQAIGQFISNFFDGKLPSDATQWISNYFPVFRYFDLSNLYSMGEPPIGLSDCLLRLLYGLLWIAIPMAFAMFGFKRKAL
ncbi:ABC transporter permease [Candidatus Sumerlaeota bacterium]|nr:ABC transporter permease [Candidatus Sumerlaeota bacterium]